MFPDPIGEQWAREVQNGADPKTVVPNNFVVVRGGAAPPDSNDLPFSGAAGPSLEAAASAVPHGQIRVATAGAIRDLGGKVEWAPEVSRHGTVNQQHVNITVRDLSCFSELQANPVPRKQRIDGDKKKGMP
jgi:hypothetical protein